MNLQLVMKNRKFTLNLLDWISAGNFSGVFPGDDKSHVAKTLGKPLGWASSSLNYDIEDFFDVDLWGYGAFTLYFNADSLDAITFSHEELDEAGWNLMGVDDSFFNDMDSAQKILDENGIPSLRLPGKKYKIKKSDTAEIFECKRRLVFPVLLAGNNFQTRILFKEDGGMRGIGHPYNFRRQVLSYEKLDPAGSFTILGPIS